MSPTFVLISGCSKGIGLGLVQRFLERPNHVVIAGIRDPEQVSSQVFDLPQGKGSKIIVVKLDVLSDTDGHDVVNELTSSHGVKHLDIVIANAGVCYPKPTTKLSEVKVSDIEAHMGVNGYGVLRILKATLPLLKKSSDPKFISVGSGSGRVSLNPRINGIPYRNGSYGPSKTVNHWITKRANDEEDDITIFPVDPGFVQTEAGNRAAQAFGLSQATVTIEESCDGLMKIFDNASKATHGGKLWRFDGIEVGW
ncbi:NAD(P)-binding protein [Xylariaceae sp. FL1651]|nr:NAD(P)-binding protein [Xylariaceae sp. FL1651]